ncbi:MAG TPA: hypothetical protein VLJ41_14705 [Segetibacter sp.]|nr:hypothetical protein [Segetibacter sp.]
MKKVFLSVTVFLLLIACNNPGDKLEPKIADAGATSDTVANAVLPVPVLYKGTPAIGKSENIATVMTWNKNLIEGKVDSIAQFIADSLTVTLADGTHMELSHDSAVAILKNFRKSMDSASQQYYTAIAVDNKTVGDEWVIQWTNETYHYKGGKKEQANICESYLLKNGKIRQIGQYAQKMPKMK